MNRRSFVKNTGILVAGTALAASTKLNASPFLPPKNKLPRWRGFNLLDFYLPNPAWKVSNTTEDQFKFMHDWGFDFIRLPIAYPTYLKIDINKNITPEETYHIDEQRIAVIDSLIQKAFKYNIHVSLNLHRAPGYCINAGFNEPFNLWKDKAAQDAFNYHWGMWAKLYKNVSAQKISFDLLNEPGMRDNMNDQHARVSTVPGPLYRQIVKGAADVIHQQTPGRLVIADGNDAGNSCTPALVGLPVQQSCRGYYPGSVSHYKAPWANTDPEHMPPPQWPAKDGDKIINIGSLEKYYEPWVDLMNKGVGVHCGECGCWNKTPHTVFLSWFNDELAVLKKNNIGYGLWNFTGDFGVLNSGRTDVEYENWYGYKLDRKLLQLLQKY